LHERPSVFPYPYTVCFFYFVAGAWK
jgi:hypothetical protein